MTETVLTSVEDGLGSITLNRPDVLNALDPDMAMALAEASAAAAADPKVRCIVIRGAGEHFMAGGDIGYFATLLALPPAERAAPVARIIEPVHQSIRNLANASKPVLASVRGACAGFGLSLMMACDLAVASRRATFSLAYCRIGASPDGGSTHSLVRLLGQRRAMELALLGDRITPEEALGLGLLNRLCEDDELEAQTTALAARLAAGPAATLARTRRLLRESSGRDLDAQLAAEEASFLEGVTGPEFAEGVTAFLEKRPPRFP